MRLDPLDEIQRLYSLLTAAERVRFLAWLTTSPTTQRPADAGGGQDDDLVTGDAAREYLCRALARVRVAEDAARRARIEAQLAGDRVRRLREQARRIPQRGAVDSAPPCEAEPVDG